MKCRPDTTAVAYRSEVVVQCRLKRDKRWATGLELETMIITTDEHWEGAYVIKTNIRFKIKQPQRLLKRAMVFRSLSL